MKYLFSITIGIILFSSVLAGSTFYTTPNSVNDGKLNFDSNLFIEENINNITSTNGLRLEAPTVVAEIESIDVNHDNKKIFTLDSGFTLFDDQNNFINFNHDGSKFKLNAGEGDFLIKNINPQNTTSATLGVEGFILTLDNHTNNATNLGSKLLSFGLALNQAKDMSILRLSGAAVSVNEYLSILNSIKIGSSILTFNSGNNDLTLNNTLNVKDLYITNDSSSGDQVVNRNWVYNRQFLTTNLLAKLKAGLNYSNFPDANTKRDADWNNVTLVGDNKIETLTPYQLMDDTTSSGKVGVTLSAAGLTPTLPPESHVHEIGTRVRTVIYENPLDDCGSAQLPGGSSGTYTYQLGVPSRVQIPFSNPPKYLNLDYTRTYSNGYPYTWSDGSGRAGCKVVVTCPMNQGLSVIAHENYNRLAQLAGDYAAASSDPDTYADGVAECLNDLVKCEFSFGDFDYLKYYTDDSHPGTSPRQAQIEFEAHINAGYDDGFAFNASCLPLSRNIIQTTSDTLR